MDSYLLRFTTISFTFIIGVCWVWLWIYEPNELNTQSLIEPPSILPPKITPYHFEPDSRPKFNSKDKIGKTISINKHECFESVVLTLKQLATFQNKRGIQTFYISNVIYDEGEYAYAYWKQDKSIIILQSLCSEITESSLYWLSGKARIDLKKVVPTGKYGNLGCCLVEKEFADKVLAWCKVGYKLNFLAKGKK